MHFRPVVSVAGIVLLVIAVAAVFAWRIYEQTLPVQAERVIVRVAAGSSARAIGRQLQDAGVDLSVDAFVALARATKATQSLRAGRYEIPRGTTMHQLLDKLRRGEVLRERFTLVEGMTLRELRAALAALPELRPDSAAMSDTALLRAIGASESHPEGLFAPDTYVFDPGSSDLDVLRQAYRAQREILQQAWEKRAPDLPYKTPYEALIMASIVEKETGQADERAMIAGVFVNRLKRRMLLQTDPSVIYGLGANFDGNLRKRDLLADTPYNTYTRVGLPPTPIAAPGRAAIAAALNPEPTEALYFVSRGDGTSHFSASLAEHNRAVAKYQLGVR
ncbi:MAG TPA: endolytic transglycosylase MltG [Burkholderiaceae bacterium]|nr:endolytic transglycosylase MltG [Burkholderiaceae bacterium]